MRIERRQQCGAFVDEADPSMAVAMNAALVAFGVSKPAFEVEVVLWEVHVVTGKLGQTSTDFEVKHRNSAPMLGIEDGASGKTAPEADCCAPFV